MLVNYLELRIVALATSMRNPLTGMTDNKYYVNLHPHSHEHETQARPNKPKKMATPV
jgi:hypothetical protein